MPAQRGRRAALQLVVATALLVAATLPVAGPRIVGSWALRSLREATTKEEKRRCIERLGRWRYAPSVDELLRILRDPESETATRDAAIEAIARIGGAAQ